MAAAPGKTPAHQDFSARLLGRVCVITGAGQGIGRALAMCFARSGACVAVADLDPDKAAAVAGEIASNGGQAAAFVIDVTRSAMVADMVARVTAAYGAPEILINNARWSELTPTAVEDIIDDHWNRALAVNVTGAFNCVRAVVPAMRQAGWGRIINMSSATVRSPPSRPYVHYITSKAALIGMTRALARELGPSGITVNAILPGAVETEIPRHLSSAERAERAKASQSISRPIGTEDVVESAVFLASEGSGFITGQSIAVDGGLTFG